jgi:hypothetical protein
MPETAKKPNSQIGDIMGTDEEEIRKAQEAMKDQVGDNTAEDLVEEDPGRR